MGGQLSSIKGKLTSDNKKRVARGDKVKISILAFEVANVMSKSIVLWQSLSDQEILRLRTEVIKAEGVLQLVSDSEAVLLGLACREKLQDLMALAGSVARLGQRCQEPALQAFEHVFGDILRQNIEVGALEFSVREMEGKVKKMERYIASTSNLYQELEILADLEQHVRRIQDDDQDGNQKDNLVALEQKISWQKQEIKYLREMSLWNRTFDKIVMLLARTICTIHARIVCVFGPPASFDYYTAVAASKSGTLRSNGELTRFSQLLNPNPPEEPQHQQQQQQQQHKQQQQQQHQHSRSQGSFLNFQPQSSPTFVDACNHVNGSSTFPSPSSGTETPQTSPVDPDLSRLTRESDSAAQMNIAISSNLSNGREERYSASRVSHADDIDDQELSSVQMVKPLNGYRNGSMKLAMPGSISKPLLPTGRLMNPRLFFDPKFIQQSAPSSTLGGSALAHHYANVIIVMEKMVKFPQLVGGDARDDLYRMLPKSLRLGLRSRLRSCFRTNANGETVLQLEARTAAAWRENLDTVLAWLAPLAHNMIRWQSEHNFEQQVVSRTNVLLLQTLFFADQLKAEAAIVELLVGLNYLCWYEKEMKASIQALDYPAGAATAASGKDLDEYLDWQFS